MTTGNRKDSFPPGLAEGHMGGDSGISGGTSGDRWTITEVAFWTPRYLVGPRSVKRDENPTGSWHSFQAAVALGTKGHGILDRARLGRGHGSHSLWHGDFPWMLELKNMSQLWHRTHVLKLEETSEVAGPVFIPGPNKTTPVARHVVVRKYSVRMS